MTLTLQQTEKLFAGKDLNFNSLGFSMLITRLKILYTKSPSQDTLKECNTAINSFIDKFKGIIGEDYEVIAKL